MRTYILCIISLFFVFRLNAQTNKHSVSIAAGFNIPTENSVYIDFDNPDYEIWADPEHKFAWNLRYMYRLIDYFGIGVYAEYESIQIEDFLFDELEASRLVFGLDFETRFPQKPLHAVGGGFFGLGTVNSDDFDNSLHGIEYGMFAGPAYSFSDLEISLFFKPKFSYFFSDKTAPETGLIMYPQVFLRVGYAF